MARLVIYRKCERCDKTGTVAGQNGSNPLQCTACGGAGELAEQELDITAIMDRLDEICAALPGQGC